MKKSDMQCRHAEREGEGVSAADDIARDQWRRDTVLVAKFGYEGALSCVRVTGGAYARSRA